MRPPGRHTLIDARRPVIGLAMDIAKAGCAAAHAHPRGQFIYASHCVMRVLCDRNIWVIPPSQAVWVPPHTEHEVYFPGQAALRNLFIDPCATSALPQASTVINVSPLLRELILKAVAAGQYLRNTSHRSH